MKRKLSIGLIVILAIGGIYLALTPPSLPERVAAPAREQQPVLPEAAPAANPTGAAADEERRAAMGLAYAGLEQGRRDLKRRLEGVKAQLWRIKLPAWEAEFIQGELLYAYSLLKNPPLLGAFHDAEEINRERDKIGSAFSRLDEVDKRIESVLSPPAG